MNNLEFAAMIDYLDPGEGRDGFDPQAEKEACKDILRASICLALKTLSTDEVRKQVDRALGLDGG